MADKKEYVKLWVSYESYFEAFSDVEVGRLVRAMIKYRVSREEPKFNGNERFIWPAIRRDIDESLEAQQASSAINRENGKKGGRPPKRENQSGFQETGENPKNPFGFSESEKRHGQGQGQGKGQGQGQGKGQSSIYNDNDPALAAVMDAYMNRIDPTPSPTSMDELKGYVGLMGADCCIRAIDAALNAKKPSWNYVRRVLMNKASQGVRCIADWDALEAKWEEEKKRGMVGTPQNGSDGTFRGFKARSALDDAD